MSVFGTKPTFELTELLIEDMIKISGFYFPFEKIDLVKMMRHTKELNYREVKNIKDLKICLYESGHVLGGSTVVVENNDKRIFYTGDINTRGSKLLRPADLDIGEIDLMLIESTYSQTEHTPREQSEKDLLEFAYQIVENGGTLFIPAFSVERSQEIACVLKAHGFPHKIVMDGMALKVNEIMIKFPQYLRDPEVFEKVILGQVDDEEEEHRRAEADGDAERRAGAGRAQAEGGAEQRDDEAGDRDRDLEGVLDPDLVDVVAGAAHGLVYSPGSR